MLKPILYPIVVAPDPILRKRAQEVEKVDNEIKALLPNMLATMYHNEGAGLAAPQVGISKRILVIDIEGQGSNPLFLINPEITFFSKELVVMKEGCLSVPVSGRVEVKRPKHIRCSYLNEDGKQVEVEDDGWLSRCIQHEIDHLNGTLLYDYLGIRERQIMIKRLKEFKKLRS